MLIRGVLGLNLLFLHVLFLHVLSHLPHSGKAGAQTRLYLGQLRFIFGSKFLGGQGRLYSGLNFGLSLEL